MAYQKFFLIAAKNMNKICEECKNQKITQEIQDESLAAPKDDNAKIKEQGKLESDEKHNEKNESDIKDSNLFKESEKSPQLEEKLDSDKKLDLSDLKAPPPGVPNSKRKRVIEGNAIIGGSQIIHGTSKVPKKISWIQL